MKKYLMIVLLSILSHAEEIHKKQPMSKKNTDYSIIFQQLNNAKYGDDKFSNKYFYDKRLKLYINGQLGSLGKKYFEAKTYNTPYEDFLKQYIVEEGHGFNKQSSIGLKFNWDFLSNALKKIWRGGL